MTSGPLNHKGRIIINQAIEIGLNELILVDNRLKSGKKLSSSRIYPNAEKCCDKFLKKLKSQNENVSCILLERNVDKLQF